MIIAIDGYSSTGKSSISKLLAARLGFVHIDTGALYRGITFFALKECFDNNKILKNRLIEGLPNLSFTMEHAEEATKLFLNNKDISNEIREPKISQYVSEIAAMPEVRTFLLNIQRKYGEKHSIVMDGRDIGTTIFPNADIKFFLTASIEERTKRRYLELQQAGKNISKEEVKENLIARDLADENRKESPLRKAKDAIVIDNSKINKEETLELMLNYIKKIANIDICKD